jgi:ribonuclease H / adenosylcobalamin/alpha-ribazole phosphatase
VVVQDPGGRVVATVAEGIGVATNNVAEYKAAIEGLERAAELGARSVLVRSDSKLLIEQLSGRWRVKSPTLITLHERVRALLGKFPGGAAFEHVPRELNRQADRLANRGVDEWLAGPGKGYRHPGPAPALFEEGSG